MNRINLATPEQAQDDLEDPGEDDGGDEVVHSVGFHQGCDDEGDGAGGGGDHGRSPANEGDGHCHGERCEQTEARIHAGDDREGDCFRDQCQCHDQAGKDLCFEPSGRFEGFPDRLQLLWRECRGIRGWFNGQCWLRFMLKKARLSGFVFLGKLRAHRSAVNENASN